MATIKFHKRDRGVSSAGSHRTKSSKTSGGPTSTKPPRPALTPRYKLVAKILYRTIARLLLRSSLPEVLLIATLCLSRYLQNSDFSYPSEVLLNIVLFIPLVTLAFYIFLALLRGPVAAHIATLLFAYSIYGYTYTFPRFHQWGDKLIPRGVTPFTHALLQAMLLAVIFGCIGCVINRLLHLKQLRNIPLLKIVIFAICFIFVVELGKVGARIWTIRADLTYKQPTVSLVTAQKTSGEKPNIYYLLFDRYANNTTLKDIYHYDNSSFTNYLTDLGFVTREDAYANYPFTTQSVSSTLSMDYHATLAKQFQDDAKPFQTAFPYRTILDNPPVAQVLKANGYSYNQVSSWWDFTRNIPSADTEPSESFRLRMFGKNFWLTDLQRDIVNKSLLSPLLLKGATVHHTTLVQYQLDRNPAQNFNTQINALKKIAQNSSHQKQPQFTFAHVLSPHDPYVFGADGNPPKYDNNRTDDGVDETVKYTNQLSYVNTRFEDLLSTIRAQDPGAVIIVQADEGPYPKQFRGKLAPNHYYNPINLPLPQMRQKFGILASYYLPDTSTQAVADNITSSVNSFRFVLDRYLGYALPMLPDCQFTAGDKYNLYTYELVTGRLKNTTDPPTCLQYK